MYMEAYNRMTEQPARGPTKSPAGQSTSKINTVCDTLREALLRADADRYATIFPLLLSSFPTYKMNSISLIFYDWSVFTGLDFSYSLIYKVSLCITCPVLNYKLHLVVFIRAM